MVIRFCLEGFVIVASTVQTGQCLDKLFWVFASTLYLLPISLSPPWYNSLPNIMVEIKTLEF
jgi:hypothetical protein